MFVVFEDTSKGHISCQTRKGVARVRVSWHFTSVFSGVTTAKGTCVRTRNTNACKRAKERSRNLMRFITPSSSRKLRLSGCLNFPFRNCHGFYVRPMWGFVNVCRVVNVAINTCDAFNPTTRKREGGDEGSHDQQQFVIARDHLWQVYLYLQSTCC